jgi:ABC-type multidrug transport system ATPase subunit
MDEPTSGLDARAAAIVMRTVRNTVDTGRTVVCTIHQPSIDIFEAFDEASLESLDLRVSMLYISLVDYYCISL